MITTSLHKLAARFMNLKEVAGTTHSPQIMAMLHLDAAWPSGDEVPWCSAFVNYVAWLLGLPRSKSLAARSWLQVGRPITLAEAVCGNDIVIFSRGGNPAQGHVAIFDRLDGDGVFVLGGNQGDAVTVARFSAASVIGVRRLA